MPSDDKLSSLMTDVVRYERTIGELLEKNETLNQEVATYKAGLSAAFDNRQESMGSELAALNNMVLRLSEQQGRQFDMLFRLMAQRGQGNKAENAAVESLLAQGFDRSAAFSETMSRFVTGHMAERTSCFSIDVSEDEGVRALRGTVSRDAEITPTDGLAVILTENAETGVHSLIFPCSEVSATSFRGFVAEVLPQEVKVLRIRVRQGDNWLNHAEINVDLKTLRHANFQTSFTLGHREVNVTPLEQDWVRIQIGASLELGDSPIEIELISMNQVTSNSSQRKGSGRRAFAVRTLEILRSEGLKLSQSNENAHAELSDPSRTAPSVTQVEIKTPNQERQRREKREAYLASGAYRKLNRFRNIHAGKRAFIIGNGPSINDQDLTLLKDEVTFVTNWFVNHPQYNEIDPSYFCVSSHEMFGGWGTPEPSANQDWLQQMLARGSRAHKFFSYPFRDFLIGDGVFPEDQCDFLLFDRPKYQVDQKGDINLDLTQPMDDGYTGIVTFCLPLAHFMGIKEIYLLGCDCDYGLTTPDAPKSYFYDFSKHTTKTTSHEGLTRVWAENGPVFQSYEIVRNRFLQDGIQIINCTNGGRLEVFPRARFEDIIANKS